MSKMYVILIVFLVNRIINAEDSNEEKYIDLLPEKEKAEFLENIARRIFNGVQSKDDREGVTGEVSDTELSEHNAFVNQILKEESKNLRKNGVKAGNNDYLNHKTDKNDEKSLEKKDTQDAVDDAKLVDLTLRDNKRDKRHSLTNTDKESKIVRINVSKSEIKKQDQEIDDGAEKEEKEGSDREDIQIKHFPRASVNNMNDPEVTTNSKTTNFDEENYKGDLKETVIATQSNVDELVNDSKLLETKEDKNKDYIKDIKDINGKGSTHISIASQDDLDHSVKDARSQEYKKEQSNKHMKENEDSSPKTNESYEKKNFEEKSEEKSIVNTSMRELTTSDVRPTVIQTEKITVSDYTTDTNENRSPNARFLRSYTESNNSEDSKNKNISEGLNSNKIELVSVALETINGLYQVNSSDNIKNESKTEKEANIFNENFVKSKSTTSDNVMEHSLDIDTTEKGLDVTTLKTEVLTKASMRTGMKSSDSDDYNEDETIKTYKEPTRPKVTDDLIHKKINPIKKGKEKHDKLNMNSYRFVNDMIKVIRAKIKPDTHLLNTIPLYDALKSKKYEVYEVPADKKPFIKKHQINKNKENPYYVPIYNYSPENAYYNPHNKFGPNADDNKHDIVNRSFENEKYNDEKDDDSSEDKNDKDVSNVGFEENESTVTDELKKYGGNYKSNSDRKFEKLIKGYAEYNQRKFKFGSNKQQRMKTSSYKLNLPIVVQHPKFTDIILNPNDYLDVDYSDRKEEIPNIRSRCELPRQSDLVPESNEEIDIKNLKSHLKSARLMLYKKKMFGYVPPANASREENKDDTVNKTKEALRSKNGKDEDENKNIAMDYYFGKPHDERFNNIDIYQPRGKYLDNYDEINNDYKYNNKYKVFRNENERKPVTTKQIYNSRTELRSNKKKLDFENIREILSITDANDLIPTLDKLWNLTTRSGDDELEPYVTVLANMMINDSKALKQYDWLGTTVDIQSALWKLMNMTDRISDGITLPRPDLELLKYTIYLHKSTKKIRKQSRKTKILPRNKKKRRGIIKESGLLNRHWLFRMLAKKYDTIITGEDFEDFNDFLNELQYYLYDLHTAVQQIVNITKYNSQNWFRNLKELYLDTKRKHLLEILLHLTTTRLLDLIKDGAKNGVTEDYLTFVINNEKIVKRTQAEITFAQKIIDGIMMDKIK